METERIGTTILLLKGCRESSEEEKVGVGVKKIRKEWEVRFGGT